MLAELLNLTGKLWSMKNASLNVIHKLHRSLHSFIWIYIIKNRYVGDPNYENVISYFAICGFVSLFAWLKFQRNLESANCAKLCFSLVIRDFHQFSGPRIVKIADKLPPIFAEKKTICHSSPSLSFFRYIFVR